jgi:arylformamidase
MQQPRVKGPLVWLDMDQDELDAAYDQTAYAPMIEQHRARFASMSAEARKHLGEPLRLAYGPSEPEKLDIFKAKQPNAPMFVFIHGGAWLRGEAKNYAFPAEMFVNAGAHYIALDFVPVGLANGDFTVMAEQVRRAVAWVYKNAEKFGGDRNRLYVGGHSSGGHLCGVCAVTDWDPYGIPADAVKGWMCMSGMYDMKPVRLSKRSSYIKFTDAMEHAMSAQRQIDKISALLVITYGTNESPEFQRQSRDFAAAINAAGKPVTLIEAQNYNHFEMCETVGNPYGPNGRAALKLMGFSA